MFLKDGRISWPIFLALVYGTLVLLGTDFAWRMLAGPAALFAGGGVVALVAGCGAIFFVGARLRRR